MCWHRHPNSLLRTCRAAAEHTQAIKVTAYVCAHKARSILEARISLSASLMIRVGQNLIYIRCMYGMYGDFWQGNHQIYGHLQHIYIIIYIYRYIDLYTILTNPTCDCFVRARSQGVLGTDPPSRLPQRHRFNPKEEMPRLTPGPLLPSQRT